MTGSRRAGTGGRRGRDRPRRQFRQRLALRSRRAWAWSIRYITRGWATRKPSTAGPARRGSAAGQRDDVGDRRLAEEDRDLAEEVAACERRALLPSIWTSRVALEDHVEAGAGQALAEDALADRGTRPPRTCRRRPRSCGVCRSAEQREPGERCPRSPRASPRPSPPVSRSPQRPATYPASLRRPGIPTLPGPH